MDKSKVDYGSIINKILGWGFAPVFVILGIILLALHDKIDVSETMGVVVIVLGVITYLITYAVDSITNSALKKNKELTIQIEALNQKISDLEAQIAQLEAKLSKYEGDKNNG